MSIPTRLWRALWGTTAFSVLLALPSGAFAADSQAEIVSFPGDSNRTLGGLLYMPQGPGPFPALIYNHGSAPGRQNDQAFEQLGPLFASQGWVFFAPYRRGQGLSAGPGRYILAEMSIAQKRRAQQMLPILVPAFICLVIAALVILRRYRAWLRVSAAIVLAVLGFATFQLLSTSAHASAMMHLMESEHKIISLPTNG